MSAVVGFAMCSLPVACSIPTAGADLMTPPASALPPQSITLCQRPERSREEHLCRLKVEKEMRNDYLEINLDAA